MQVGIIATNGGKHSDERMAIAVAQDIIVIGANASGEQAAAGRRLENQMIDIMVPYFKGVSEYEHGGIAEKGTAHLASPIEAHEEIAKEASDKILAAIDASPFKDWFSADQARAYVMASVGKFIGCAQHMHRDWFARHGKIGDHLDLKVSDKHDPDCPHVQRWKDMHDGDAATIIAARAEHNEIIGAHSAKLAAPAAPAP